MYKIKYQISINNKELQQTLFLTKDAVLIKVNNQQILYIREQNNCFEVDQNAKTLKQAFSDTIKQQMEYFKTMIGKVECTSIIDNYTYSTYKGREIKFSGDGGEITLNTKLITAQINDVDETAYSSYLENEGENQILQLPLNSNEIVAYIHTNILMPQGEQTTTTELLNIEIEDIDLTEILNYAIIS